MTTETTPQTKNGHKAIMLPYDAIMAQVSEEIEKHIVDNGGSAYMVDFTTNVLLPAKASENAKDLQKQRNWAVAPEVKGIRLDDLANSLASNLGVNTRLGFPLCRDFVLALIEDKHLESRTKSGTETVYPFGSAPGAEATNTLLRTAMKGDTDPSS